MKKSKRLLNFHQCAFQALALAEKYRGSCAPNPSVGAVIVSKSGEVISKGSHRGPGTRHAEVEAICKLQTIPKDAILFITLEPCCHYGRTPPCTEAIIASGIKHVVYSYNDPNPIVSGRSKTILEKAGIRCEFLAINEINQFYQSYHYWHKTRLPFVTAKIAMTLDAKISAQDGSPIKITGDEINDLTHQFRYCHDALLTTAKTIKLDNPKLNVRLQNTVLPKPLYILDSSLTVSLNANVFQTMHPITIFHGSKFDLHHRNKLADLGVCCIEVSQDENGLLNLTDILIKIGADGVHDLWIEAGSTCFNRFLQERKTQKVILYVAPFLLGEGTPAFLNNFSYDFSHYDMKLRKYGKDILCEMTIQERL